jgi:predicted nucleic acid-binding protein
VNVLVDTPVWSLALRRQPKAVNAREHSLKSELTELIREGRAELLGAVRQELLSGLREEAQFNRIREYLQGFSDPTLHADDYEEAARCSNICRAKGIATSPVDMIICASALKRDWSIFTPDQDFRRYGKFLPIKLHQPRS